MAQRYPTAPQVVDPVEHQINEKIDSLIRLLNVRRTELLDIVPWETSRREFAERNHRQTDGGPGIMNFDQSDTIEPFINTT